MSEKIDNLEGDIDRIDRDMLYDLLSRFEGQYLGNTSQDSKYTVDRIKNLCVKKLLDLIGDDGRQVLINDLRIQYDSNKILIGLIKDKINIVGSTYFDDMFTKVNDFTIYGSSNFVFDDYPLILKEYLVDNLYFFEKHYHSNLHDVINLFNQFLDSDFTPQGLLKDKVSEDTIIKAIKKHFSLFVEMWFIDEFPKSAFEKIMNDSGYNDKVKKEFKHRHIKDSKKQEFMKLINKDFVGNFFKSYPSRYEELDGWIDIYSNIPFESEKIINSYIDYVNREIDKLMSQFVEEYETKEIKKTTHKKPQVEILPSVVEDAKKTPIILEEPKVAERKSVALPEDIQNVVNERKNFLMEIESLKLFNELLKKLKKTFEAERFIESKDIKKIVKNIPEDKKTQFEKLIVKTEGIWNTFYQTTNPELLKKLLEVPNTNSIISIEN